MILPLQITIVIDLEKFMSTKPPYHLLLLLTFGILACLSTYWLSDVKDETYAMPLFESPLKPTPIGYEYGPIGPELPPGTDEPIYMYVIVPHPSPSPTPTRIPDYTPPQTVLNLDGELSAYGWYRSFVTATFVTTDDMTGIGTTEYRLDGAASWQRRQYYYPPLVLTTEGSHLLSYRSLDKLHNTESEKSTTVNIDLTAPVITPTLEGVYLLNGWYRSPVTVDITGQDNLSGIVQREINLSGAGWQSTSASPVISHTGHHTLTYRAFDRAENVSQEQSITFKVDVTPPTTTHILSGTLAPNGWYQSSVTVTLVSTDTGIGHHQTIYRLDGGPAWWIYGGPFVINTNGPHTLEYYATDKVNNSEAIHTVNFNLDLSAPASAHPSISGTLGANGWYISPITLTLTAVDGQVEVDYIEYNWQQSGWLTYTQPITAKNEGFHQLALHAVDKTGHLEATKWFTAQVDLTPPVITIQPVLALTRSSLMLMDIYTATDDVSGIDLLIASVGGRSVQVGQGLPLGTNTLVVTATNKAGLQSQASQILMVEGEKTYLPIILKPSPPPCEYPPFCW